jgi:hypothetical protein
MNCKACGKSDDRTKLKALYCLDCFTKPLWERQQALKKKAA